MPGRQDVSLIPTNWEYFVETILEYLRINRPDDYQDFLESNNARVLIDAFGWSQGLLAYYVQTNLLQMFLPTHTTRQASYYLGKLVNYNLRGSQPSHATVTFRLLSAHSQDILIPALTQLQASGTPNIIFETDDDVVLEAGELSVDVTVTQGETLTEVLGTTSGSNLPDQQFLSTRVPLFETVSLTVDGIAWTLFENLFDATSDDRAYTAQPNEQGYALFTFGNGFQGAIPPPNAEVEVTYRTGGGEFTNVKSQSITDILSTITDTLNNPVTLSVANASPAVGGLDQESVAEAKINIPRSVRSMGRFVSREDFQAIPSLFSGPEGSVYKSTATVNYTWAEHLITIYILEDPPVGTTQPAIPDDDLLEAVRLYVEERTLPGVGISVESATLVPIDITGTVYFRSNYRLDFVRTQVESALANLLSPTIREIGDGLRLSDIYGAIDGTTGVDYVDIAIPTANRSADSHEFFVLGTVTLTYVRLPRVT